MSTATMAIDGLKAIARERRALEERLQDASEELSAHQLRVQQLAAALADPANDGIDATLPAERQRLRELAGNVGAARADLAAFNRDNPTAAELERREREAAAEADRKAKREVLEADGADLVSFIDAMDAARKAYESMAQRRSDSAKATNLLHLNFLLPIDFWEMSPGRYSVGGAMPWCGRRPKLIEWLSANKLPAPELPTA